MSASQLRAAWRIWQQRREQTDGDKAYSLYALLLVAVIVLSPVVRALWVLADSPGALATLISPHAPALVSAFVVTVWVVGLLVGRKLGPALLSPFLLHALTSSGIRRSLTLRRPVLRSVAITAFVFAIGAMFLGAVLLSHGVVQLWDVVGFVTTSIAAGVVSATLWLVGQVFPRAVFPLALTVFIIAGASLLMPQMLAFTPWGWVGATYPSRGPVLLPLVCMLVLAVASLSMTPVLLNRLTSMQLDAQATQRERAVMFSFSFDFRAVASVYETGPRLGRRFHAIFPSKYRWVTFFVRGMVGQARTPVQSLSVIIAAATAGAMLTLSYLLCAPSVLLAGAAGIVLYWATDPFTKGLQRAASVAGDYPLYGISDRRLLFLHALFPLTALLAILLTTSIVTALVNGISFGVAIFSACAVSALTFALRVSSTLKGPLPPSLLTPVNSPAGDLSIVMQIGWVFSDPLLAILGAVVTTWLPVTPIPFVLLASGTTALIVFRWKNRR